MSLSLHTPSLSPPPPLTLLDIRPFAFATMNITQETAFKVVRLSASQPKINEFRTIEVEHWKERIIGVESGHVALDLFLLFLLLLLLFFLVHLKKFSNVSPGRF